MSSIEILGDEHEINFKHLYNIPLRDHDDFYTLEDIDYAQKHVETKDINLLFVIREVFNFFSQKNFSNLKIS